MFIMVGNKMGSYRKGKARGLGGAPCEGIMGRASRGCGAGGRGRALALQAHRYMTMSEFIVTTRSAMVN